MRAGAWEAVHSARPDAVRQAAHSGRELIDQTLKALAPDKLVRDQPWFNPNKTSRSGITRRHRIRLVIQERRGKPSRTDLDIAAKACELVLVIDKKLTALSHARSAPSQRDVADALRAAEIALERILL